MCEGIYLTVVYENVHEFVGYLINASSFMGINNEGESCRYGHLDAHAQGILFIL